MRASIGLGLFLMLSPVFAAAADAVNTYKQAIEYCAGESIGSFDDGVSSPIVVARVILGVCHRKHSTLYTAAKAGRSDLFMVGFERAALEEFTGFVLWHRTNKWKASR